MVICLQKDPRMLILLCTSVAKNHPNSVQFGPRRRAQVSIARTHACAYFKETGHRRSASVGSWAKDSRKHCRNTPGILLKHFWQRTFQTDSRNLAKTIPKYLQDTQGKSLNRLRNTPETLQEHSRNTAEASLKHSWNIHETHLKHIWNIGPAVIFYGNYCHALAYRSVCDFNDPFFFRLGFN